MSNEYETTIIEGYPDTTGTYAEVKDQFYTFAAAQQAQHGNGITLFLDTLSTHAGGLTANQYQGWGDKFLPGGFVPTDEIEPTELAAIREHGGYRFRAVITKEA